MTLIKADVTIKDAVDRFGKQITVVDGAPQRDYFFLPYWFKKEGDNHYEMIPFEMLPGEVKDIIIKQRGGE